MNQDTSKKVSIIYMVAGLSSRFNGKIKQFAIVGPNGETLIEYSMKQAISAGFSEIVFIVGEKTEIPFKEKFGNVFMGFPIKYAKQSFNPNERDKPWGTVDAVVSAKELIDNSFVLCNGDDLYGEEAFRIMRVFLENSSNKNECASLGYELGKVLPDKGGVNRGVYSFDENNFITGIIEHFNINRDSLTSIGLNEKTLVSMNLFGLKKETVRLMKEKLLDFKQAHIGDRKSECLLPTELGNLIKDGKIKMKLLPTSEKWFGITNPEDEETVRNALSKTNA